MAWSPLRCLLTFCLYHVAWNALIGIDFGSEFVKVAVIKSGTGLDIVLNEQTKRKTKTYVGFRGNERYFGEDAYNLHTRFPSGMVTYLKHLIGVPNDGMDQWKELYRFPFFSMSPTDRGSIKVHVDEKIVYTAEELLGMYLDMVKDMAEKQAEQTVTDCMITIPASFSTKQLQAILDAAQLANLNVLSFMHDTAAAALQFGVQQRGFDNTTNVVVFDMGSSKLEIGVFTFGQKPDDAKRAKKFDSTGLGTMTVRAIESDAGNGGRNYDALIADHIASEFQKKSGVNVLAQKSSAGHKAVAKLMRTAQKVKETLSANKDARASVEGIWDEADFNTVVLREKFEELAQPLLARAIETFKRAVAKAGLTMEEIDSVELMGGGSRIPLLQNMLLEAYGKKQLGRTLNTDEAIALGATFHGARLSGSFRVRSFALVEHDTRNISFALSPTEANPKPAVRALFSGGRYPSKKLVTVFRTHKFNVTTYIQDSTSASDSDSNIPLAQYVLKGVGAAFGRMSTTVENVHPDSKKYVELKFRLADGGLLTLDSAIAKHDQVVNVTRLVKVKNTTEKAVMKAERKTDAEADDKATESGEDGEEKSKYAVQEEKEGNDDDTKDDEKAEDTKTQGSSEEEKRQKSDNEAGDDNKENNAETDQKAQSTTSATDADTASKEEPKFKQVNTTKIIHRKEQITFTTIALGTPRPMATVDFVDSNYKLEKLKKRDAEKLEIAHAKNSLEAFIISTKYDGFFEDESLRPFYDEKEAKEIRTALSDAEEWMDQLEAVSVSPYEKKLKYLQSLTAPIHKRKADKEKEAPKLATQEDGAAEQTAEQDAAISEKGASAKAAPETAEGQPASAPKAEEEL